MDGFRLPFSLIIEIRNDEVSTMLRDYIQAAMRRAKYEILPDDGSFYGEIPGFDGVYANADKLEKCREELEEVLEEWILMRVSRNLALPVVEGIELVIKETA
jgi:predicted RNase H-like HicB family nuclease